MKLLAGSVVIFLLFPLALRATDRLGPSIAEMAVAYGVDFEELLKFYDHHKKSFGQIPYRPRADRDPLRAAVPVGDDFEPVYDLAIETLESAIRQPSTRQEPLRLQLYSDVLSELRSAFRDGRLYEITGSDVTCDGGLDAYVDSPDFKSIYFCPSFFKNISALHSRLVIHEILHVLGGPFRNDGNRDECPTYFMASVIWRAGGQVAEENGYARSCRRQQRYGAPAD